MAERDCNWLMEAKKKWKEEAETLADECKKLEQQVRELEARVAALREALEGLAYSDGHFRGECSTLKKARKALSSTVARELPERVQSLEWEEKKALLKERARRLKETIEQARNNANCHLTDCYNYPSNGEYNTQDLLIASFAWSALLLRRDCLMTIRQCKYLESRGVDQWSCLKLGFDVSHRKYKCLIGDCLLYQPEGGANGQEKQRERQAR